jgi:hypothetical protein
MTFGVPAEPYEVNPVIERAMRRIFILHADHEQNASTSTVRLAGSSGANPFACIAAGIACLWGPAHGGANEAALNMLREIGTVAASRIYRPRQGQGRSVPADGLRPPRLQEFRPAREGDAEDRRRGAEGARHHRSGARRRQELEHIALNDEYFIEKKLYPNVDFYSGVILSAIGFPTSMFTALFALARTVGWVAQWNEMISDPEQKIGRPRQLYTGADAARLRAGRRRNSPTSRAASTEPEGGRAVPRLCPRRGGARTNSVTGRRYADDPAIMAWQLANEPRPAAATRSGRPRCRPSTRGCGHRAADQVARSQPSRLDRQRGAQFLPAGCRLRDRGACQSPGDRLSHRPCLAAQLGLGRSEGLPGTWPPPRAEKSRLCRAA